MKRFISATAALLTALCMPAAQILAAEPEASTVTIDQKAAGHTFTAYQIFEGSVDDSDGKMIFSNLEWGSSVDTAAFTDQAVYPFTTPFKADNAQVIADELSKMDSQQALQAARVLAQYVHTPAASSKSDAAGYELSGLRPGYYLIEDTLDSSAKDTAASAMILTPIDGSITITPKDDVPTLTKSVMANKDSVYKIQNDTETMTWTNTADYSEGDVIDYRMEVTVPASAKYYKDYSMSVSDSIPAGLTLDKGSVMITAEDGTGQTANVTTDFQVTEKDGGLDISDPNIKKININGTPLYDTSNPKLVITYQATLNKNAVLAPESNDNTAQLTYSDSPSDSTSRGQTEKVTAGVYTFEVDLHKTDEQGKALTGAGFTLYKEEGGVFKKVAVENTAGVSDFTFKGLGSGTYKLVESTTPDGYNTMKDIEFSITASYDGTDIHHMTLSNVEFNGLDGKQDNVGQMSVTIENRSGAILPKTGSSILLIVLVIGAALIAYGVYAKRKESR